MWKLLGVGRVYTSVEHIKAQPKGKCPSMWKWLGVGRVDTSVEHIKAQPKGKCPLNMEVARGGEGVYFCRTH